MKTDGSDKNQKTEEKKDSPEDAARKSLQHQIEKMASQFENALPNKIGVERMMRIVMTAILNNPKLALCEPNSFFGALLQSLQLGLEVNTPMGQAYLIPRWDKKYGGYKCNFQLGYQGLLDLCYRWGKYREITAEIVYEGDDFSYEYGTSQYLRHIPKNKTEKPTFVWAKYELENGGQRFVVWTWERVWKHAMEFSESYDSEKGTWKFSAWSSNQESKESMGQKTVLHNLLKFAPKSVELSQAVSADEKSVIARPYSEGGEMKFQFDVEPPAMIEGPDEEAKKFANQVNNGAGKKAATAATQEAETEQAQTASTAKPKPKAASSLFTNEEDEALAEEYERHQSGVVPPDFG